MDNNVKHMLEQVKWGMVESASAVRVGGKNPKGIWWNNEVKAAVKRKEVLPASDEETKERCMETEKKGKG